MPVTRGEAVAVDDMPGNLNGALTALCCQQGSLLLREATAVTAEVARDLRQAKEMRETPPGPESTERPAAGEAASALAMVGHVDCDGGRLYASDGSIVMGRCSSPSLKAILMAPSGSKTTLWVRCTAEERHVAAAWPLDMQSSPVVVLIRKP